MRTGANQVAGAPSRGAAACKCTPVPDSSVPPSELTESALALGVADPGLAEKLRAAIGHETGLSLKHLGCTGATHKYCVFSMYLLGVSMRLQKSPRKNRVVSNNTPTPNFDKAVVAEGQSLWELDDNVCLFLGLHDSNNNNTARLSYVPGQWGSPLRENEVGERCFVPMGLAFGCPMAQTGHPQ